MNYDCPNCGNEMKFTTSIIGHKRDPSSGDFSVCAKCAHVIRFDPKEGYLRLTDESDRADLKANPELVQAILDAQRYLIGPDIEFKGEKKSMGYYINTINGVDLPKRAKANALIQQGAQLVFIVPDSIAEVPPGKALVCVVQNGPFDAAAVIIDDRELKAVANPSDGRPRSWLMMDRETAFKAANIKEMP